MTPDAFYIYESDSRGKARILQAGLRLFAENGLAATSIRDIAAATGMSNPALYKHFATKHDLALVLFERLYREHLMRLTGAMGQQSNFSDKLHAFVATYLGAYDAHPHATMFTTDNFAALWPDVSQAFQGRTVLTLLRDLLSRGRSNGGVSTATDIDLQLSLVVGTLSQVTRQMYFGTLEGPAANHTDGIVRILRKGLS